MKSAVGERELPAGFFTESSLVKDSLATPKSCYTLHEKSAFFFLSSLFSHCRYKLLGLQVTNGWILWLFKTRKQKEEKKKQIPASQPTQWKYIATVVFYSWVQMKIFVYIEIFKLKNP